MRSRRLRASFGTLLGLVALTAGVLVGPADAQTNPFQRGPNPTNASLEAATGPFAIATTAVPAQAGFNGGTIYYPTDTSQGTFGAVVVLPGFLSFQSAMAWTGPKVATHGFVVMTIDTFTPFDFPFSRATQQQAALTWLTTQSSVRNRIDPNRLGAAGWSMGGGASLETVRDKPTMQAAVAFQPWDLGQAFNTVRVPSGIVGAEVDFIAPVASHSEPFYDSIPATAEKAYIEVAGADHFLGSRADTTQAKFTVVWLKRYIDNDTRYEPFMCPPPSGPTIREYRNTCPG